MEPRIQYAKTSDGVSIAFYSLGRGVPVVAMPSPPFNHIGMDFRWPHVRPTLERISERGKLIRYDARGCGLSDRDVADISLDSYLLDLEAVVGQLQLERFVLIGWVNTGPVAIAYAVRHSDRVSHLILSTTYARGADLFKSSTIQAFRALREKDWDLYIKTIAHNALGWSSSEEAQEYAAYLRECVTEDGANAAWRAAESFDVTGLLAQVRCPTLVLHATSPVVEPELSRRLASGIPDARFVVLEPTPGVPLYQNVEPAARAIEEFVFEGEGPTAALDLPQGTAVILFADIADSTGLTERLGDQAFREKARELDDALRGIIRENGGTPVEGRTLGDGVLAVFTSARRAIEGALRCAAAGSHGGLPLHLGIHAGDVIREEGNVYGGAVNIAARIAAASAAGEVLVSDTVRSLARTSAGVRFEDRGEQSLKGVSEPVRVWAVEAPE